MLAAAGRTNTRLRRSSSKSRIEPGQLTPKMQKFLAEAKDSEPFLVVDVDIVEHNYRELRRLLPAARHMNLSGAAHMAPVTQPERVNSYLIEYWVKGTGCGAGGHRRRARTA